jgi:hypothetical protein
MARVETILLLRDNMPHFQGALLNLNFGLDSLLFQISFPAQQRIQIGHSLSASVLLYLQKIASTNTNQIH